MNLFHFSIFFKKTSSSNLPHCVLRCFIYHSGKIKIYFPINHKLTVDSHKFFQKQKDRWISNIKKFIYNIHFFFAYITECLAYQTVRIIDETLKSTCGERWRVRTHHTLAWRSTSAGRWTGKPGWILRSIRSTSSQGEQ